MLLPKGGGFEISLQDLANAYRKIGQNKYLHINNRTRELLLIAQRGVDPKSGEIRVIGQNAVSWSMYRRGMLRGVTVGNPDYFE